MEPYPVKQTIWIYGMELYRKINFGIFDLQQDKWAELATNALPCEVTFQGETTIFAYEVSEEPPHLNELSHYGTKNPYQVMNFCIYCNSE